MTPHAFAAGLVPVALCSLVRSLPVMVGDF